MNLKVLATLSVLLTCLACPPQPPNGITTDAGNPLGVDLPAAPLELPQSMNVPREPPATDGGAGFAEWATELSGPASETLSLDVRQLDGGLVEHKASIGQPVFQLPPLSEFLFEVTLDGGTTVSLRLDTGQPNSRVLIDASLLRVSRGMNFGSANAGQPPPFDGAWVHRPTHSIIVRWAGRYVLLKPDSSAVGVNRTDLGAAPTGLTSDPCFTKEGQIVFLRLADGTVAIDLSTQQRLPGAIVSELDPALCHSARKGVPRAMLSHPPDAISVVEWSAAGVVEVTRETGSLIRGSLSADGTTIGILKSGTSASGWVAERVVLQTGQRQSVTVGGPAHVFLPSDGRTLLFLASLGTGGVWQPCALTPSDGCLLFGASVDPIGSVQGMAVADAAPKIFLAVRDAPSGTQTDRLLHIDLDTNVTTPTRPPNYNGLPSERRFLRGNLLPTHRGVANAVTNTVELTNLGILQTTVASDGSIWAAQDTGSPLGSVDHETGTVFRGPFRQATLAGTTLSIGQRIVSRSAVQVLGSATRDARWNDAPCILFLASDVLGRGATPLRQSIYCSP